MKKLLFTLTLLVLSLTAEAGLVANHYYRLSIGGLSAFVENASTSASAKVLLWTETATAAQRWQLLDRGDGTYQLVNVYSDQYLTSVSGSVIQRTLATARAYGIWTVEPVEGKEDTYRLVNKEQLLTVASVESGQQLTTAANATDNPEWQLVEDDTTADAYNADVRDAVMKGFIDKYYRRASTGCILGNGGWWGDAEMFETILDAFETTGDKTYQTYFQQLYANFNRRNGTDWSGNEYNDDITWMVLACIRAYKFFGNADYLNKAKANYDKMYARAIQPYGTLIWKQSQSNKLATNSCINCPATIAAVYLAEQTGDKSYYDKALTLYAAQRKLLYEASSGKVNDSGEWNDQGVGKVNNGWASTYNQGTMLGAALMLYDYTKQAVYKQDAERIHSYTYKNLCNSQHLVNVCQTIQGDLCGFKGIYMRYARRYAQELDHEDALQWMELNAWHAFQNRNSQGVIWSAWLTKTSEDLKRVEGSDNKTCEPFSASTAVSVAFNAHVNRQFSKAAFENVYVRHFDDIQRFQLEDDETEGDLVTTPSTNKSHLGFRNVDFGRTGKVASVSIRANATLSRSRILVYIDSIADSQLIGRSELVPQEWTDMEIPVDITVSGKHAVFIAFEGTGVQLHSFRFADQANSILPLRPAAEAPAASSTNYYDLQGRTLSAGSKALTPKGIYINGGRKFLNR